MCSALAACSAQIWSERARAERVGLRRLETTDTELLVQNLTEVLARTGEPASLRVFSAHDEADYGADLEVWLALDHGFSIGLTMQAKRTTFTTTRLLQAQTIIQQSGTAGRGTRQLDDLITHGRTVHANPIHVLYSGWNAPRTTDPLVRGRWTPTQCGASVLPTWWFREGLGWARPTRIGTARIDPYTDVVLPLELLLKPEDIRQPSSRARTSADHRWFEDQFNANRGSINADSVLSPLSTASNSAPFVPYDRRFFARVKALFENAFGPKQTSSELVDYALLGIGLGSLEYGPNSGSTPTDPFDFGLARDLPRYVPACQVAVEDDERGASPDDHDRGTASDDHDRAEDDATERVYQPVASTVQVEIIDDRETEDELRRAAGVEQLPRIVMSLGRSA